jgi:hypothetical protein
MPERTSAQGEVLGEDLDVGECCIGNQAEGLGFGVWGEGPGVERFGFGV